MTSTPAGKRADVPERSMHRPPGLNGKGDSLDELIAAVDRQVASVPGASAGDDAAEEGGKPSYVKVRLRTGQAQHLWEGKQGDLAEGASGAGSADAAPTGGPKRRRGRRRPVAAGMGFADDVSRLTLFAIRHDDPYAFARLVELDGAMAALREAIESELADIRAAVAVDEEAGFVVEGVDDRLFEPRTYAQRLRSAYAWDGLRLLARFDYLLAWALTGRNTGLLHGLDVRHLISRFSKDFYRLFEAARVPRLSGASRADFREGNARAIEAAGTFGAIDEDIAFGRVQPRLLHIEVPGGRTAEL